MKDSLSIFSLVNFARHEWVNNPLVQIMKRKVRKFYVYIIAFQVIVFTQFQIVSWLIGASGITSLSMIIVPLIYLAPAMIWLIKAIVPIFFADWAYREVWAKDETLRVSQLTFRDWLAAIMLPLMQLVGVLFFVGFVAYLIMSAVILWNSIAMTSEPLSSRITYFVFRWGAGMLLMPISYGMYAILAITLVLRRIMQLAEGRPAASALPQLALLIAGFAGIFLFFETPTILVWICVWAGPSVVTAVAFDGYIFISRHLSVGQIPVATRPACCPHIPVFCFP